MPAFATPLALADLPADVWHAHALSDAPPAQVLATGHAALDAHLPGGGWPVGALTEILQPPGVHNEWRLLLPALVRSGSGPVVLVGAPETPFAPSLAAQGLRPVRLVWVRAPSAAQRLWAAEQALRCADVQAVLAWLPQEAGAVSLRRLHMAAAEHRKLLFVLRAEQAQHSASPAVLRLWMAPCAGDDPDGDALQVQVLKRRGPPVAQPVHLAPRPARLTLLLAASRWRQGATAAASGGGMYAEHRKGLGHGPALDRTAQRA